MKSEVVSQRSANRYHDSAQTPDLLGPKQFDAERLLHRSLKRTALSLLSSRSGVGFRGVKDNHNDRLDLELVRPSAFSHCLYHLLFVDLVR